MTEFEKQHCGKRCPYGQCIYEECRYFGNDPEDPYRKKAAGGFYTSSITFVKTKEGKSKAVYTRGIPSIE